MDTVVVITDTKRQASDVVAGLGHPELRCLTLPWATSAREIARLKPAALVLDDDGTRALAEAVETFRHDAGLAGTALFVVVDEARVDEAVSLEGIADFLMRPLRRVEMIARIRGALCHQDDRENVLSFCDLQIDLEGYEASLSGQRLDLTYQEFELLKFLTAHPGKAFTREQLLTRVWGYAGYGGSRTGDIHVRRIRARSRCSGNRLGLELHLQLLLLHVPP